MIHDKTILVGACDWEHSHWQGRFYPEDLPEDWRLSFYANEFSAVLVPEAKWRAEGVDLDAWADEVPEGFQFYLLSADIDASDEQVKAGLGDAFGGFVASNIVLAEGRETVAIIEYQAKSLREWKDWLLSAQCQAVFLVDEDISAKPLTEFQSLVELMGL